VSDCSGVVIFRGGVGGGRWRMHGHQPARHKTRRDAQLRKLTGGLGFGRLRLLDEPGRDTHAIARVDRHVLVRHVPLGGRAAHPRIGTVGAGELRVRLRHVQQLPLVPPQQRQESHHQVDEVHGQPLLHQQVEGAAEHDVHAVLAHFVCEGHGCAVGLPWPDLRLASCVASRGLMTIALLCFGETQATVASCLENGHLALHHVASTSLAIERTGPTSASAQLRAGHTASTSSSRKDPIQL